MNISIIISTWNNSSILCKTIEAISRCTIPTGTEWELILVNNNCSDDTDEIVAQFFNKLPLIYLHEPIQGLSVARNTGLKAASGELLIWTDDDVKPSTNWIIAYWNAYLEKPKSYFFGGPINSIFEAGMPEKELLRLSPNSVKGLNWGPVPKRLNSYEFFIAANWACPAISLEKTGGYDTKFGLNPSTGKDRCGEETDLMERIKIEGYTPWYLPNAELNHYVPKKNISLKHISSRYKANGYYTGVTQRDEYRKYILNRKIPTTIYLKIFYITALLLLSKIRGKKGYTEHMRIKHYLGIIEGIKDNL